MMAAAAVDFAKRGLAVDNRPIFTISASDTAIQEHRLLFNSVVGRSHHSLYLIRRNYSIQENFERHSGDLEAFTF